MIFFDLVWMRMWNSFVRQIWTRADQNKIGFIGRVEFYNFLKLATVAQSKQDLSPNMLWQAKADLVWHHQDLHRLHGHVAATASMQPSASKQNDSALSAHRVEAKNFNSNLGNGFVSEPMFGDFFYVRQNSPSSCLMMRGTVKLHYLVLFHAEFVKSIISCSLMFFFRFGSISMSFV